MPRIWKDDDERERGPRGDDEDGGRRKVSWREIDKRKDGSHHVREERRDPAPGRVTRAGAAYNKYRSELDRLFDSGGIAKKFKDELGEPGRAPAEVKKLRGLREASGAEFERLLSGYRAAHGMPDDVSILTRAISSPDAGTVKEAIRMLAEKAQAEKIPGRASLSERLRTVELTFADPELSELAGLLRKALGG
jgi:hypothetical protein